MRIIRIPTPFNRIILSTGATTFLVAFFSIGAFSTLTIWRASPSPEWICEIALFAVAGAACLTGDLPPPWLGFPLAGVAGWGVVQLAVGATVYRWATLNATLRNAALAGMAIAAYRACAQPRVRARFLRGFAWFGFALSVISVVAYFTSPGKILWIFPSPYPDNWGPFSSRNNFAQFLELCLPVAFYESSRGGPILLPAILLGAGLASASRAGAILLALETIAGLVLLSRRATRSQGRRVFSFVVVVVSAAALGGASRLAARFRQPDPLELRREIYRSASNMAAAHPWRGYGLGTFSTVYPEFALFDAGAVVEHAHNDWLEWAAEGGLPYALLWATLALGIAGRAWRTPWGLGVPAVFLHAIVDYPFARLGISLWVFALAAALAREKSRPKKMKTAGEKSAARTTMHEETSVKRKNIATVAALGLILILALASQAAPPAIGTIAAQGAFRIDDSTINGNATLFEGASIETRAAATALDLASGARVTLSPDSKGRIFGDRLVLEKGSGQIVKPAGFHMEARGLTVQPESGDASARVALLGARRVQVAAVTGSFEVLTSRGLLVADLAPGSALEFEPPPQAGGSEPWKLTGCLRSVSGHYLITDEITNVTVEVAGQGLEREAANRVEVTGAMDPASTPVSGATQFIRVSQIRQLGKGCAAGKGGKAAAAAGAGGAAGKAGAAGAGGSAGGITATTIAIVGGVAAAAIVGGLAAADALPGQGSSAAAPVSR